MSTPPPETTLRVPEGSAPHAHLPYAQFAPGAVIASRYRVVSLLGQGGMGEVYRADDMKLGQQVALKFLPASAARDASLLDLLHDEVRLGRQVSHPNVCRVYDIGEWDGVPFVAMEYVDGEDLARLLQRIGRLPQDKAAEIARGIAAGLSSAHAKGILHRDLKPANVMIDGRGDPRITDFGLALTAEQSVDSDVVAGTPAYMAPEQLEGKAATVQSDLYALGLVMYEMFTGRRARAGRTVRDLRRENDTEIRTPSSFIRELDPAVERVILRCLQRDPALRPRSAREVFDALPGGDALAAAVAAGETPSPRLVAAAGIEGTLSPAAAWSWVGLIVVLLAALIGVSSEWRIMSVAPFDRSPDVLEQNALDAARAVGIAAEPYRVHDLDTQWEYLAWFAEHDHTRGRLTRLRRGPAAVTFSVRQSPKPLSPLSDATRATPDDPPLTAGMSNIEVDTSGRLVALTAWPRGTPGAHANWNELLHRAGFDAASLRPVTPKAVPPVFVDERAAWEGVWPDDPAQHARIEAAATGGVPVFLRVTGDWSGSDARRRQPFETQTMVTFLIGVTGVLTIVTIVLAWRNFRSRRLDRSGAARIGAGVFCLEMAFRLLEGDHRLVLQHEVGIVVGALSAALLWAVIFVALYMALEPHVRRRWPERLIGWSRLVAGRVRDPLVGRDLLIGVAAGISHALLASLFTWLPGRLGWETPRLPHGSNLMRLLGVRFVVSGIAGAISTGIIVGLLLTVLLVLLAIVLRNRTGAAVGIFLVQLIAFALATPHAPYVFAACVVVSAIWTIVLVRVGLLAIIAAQTTFGILFKLPISVDFSAWYIASAIVPIVFTLALTAFAFRTVIGNQPLFSARLLDD